MTFTVSYAIVTSIMHFYIGGDVFVTRADLLFKSIWSNFGPHSPQCNIFLNSCQGGQLPCLLSSWKHLNNAVGHSVSFLDVIINRDSVTQMEAPLNPRPSPHVIATIPFLHLILFARRNWFLPKGTLLPRPWKVKWRMLTLLCARRRQTALRHPAIFAIEGEGDLISYTHPQHNVSSCMWLSKHRTLLACSRSTSSKTDAVDII